MTDSKEPRSDVLEAVARALAWNSCVRFLERGGVMAINPDRIQEAVDRDWELHKSDARAALTAALDHMAKPSEGMRHAVAKNWGRRTWAEFDDVLSQYRKEALGDD